MENYIYTLKAKAVIDIAKKVNTFQDFYENGKSQALPTEFIIDLTDPYHELNIVESFEDVGDCAFFDQFRKVIFEKENKKNNKNKHYYLENDKYLIKDKVVILDFEKLFFQVDFDDSIKHRMRDDSVLGEIVDEVITDENGEKYVEQNYISSGLEYLKTYDPTYSQLIRDLITFSKISIAFTKDENNEPVFHNFVAFDKSQSMARNSRIMLVSTDFLSPLYSKKRTIYSLDLSNNKNGKNRKELDTDTLNTELNKMQTCMGLNAVPEIYEYDGQLNKIPIDYYLPEILMFRSKRENKSDIICLNLPKKISEYSEALSAPRKVFVRINKNDKKEYETFYPLIENKEYTFLYYINEKTWNSIKGNDSTEKISTLRKQYADYQKRYIDKRLNLGIDFYGINLALSKFYAYRGLYLSTSKRIDGFKKLDKETIIVIPDKPYGFDSKESTLKHYSQGEKGLNFCEDFYYQKEEFCYTNTYEIVQGRINAKHDSNNNQILLKNDTMFDGEGIICPEYADYIGEQLGRKDANSFQIRMPFMKGVLHKVDFHAFLKDESIMSKYSGEYKITDCFGITRDLKEARIILTESMFKASGWLKELYGADHSFHTNTKYDDPMEFFFDKFQEYGYSLYISGSDDSYRHGNLTAINYQILNTLAIEKEELKKLADEHWTNVINPLNSLLNTVDYKTSDEENYSSESISKSVQTTNDDEYEDISEESEDEGDSLSENCNEANNTDNKNEDSINEDLNDEDWVDIESELNYETSDDNNTIVNNNYYSDATWMKVLECDSNFQYHPFIRAKLNARKVRLKRDFAQGKLLMTGEVRYLSRDLLLLLKYLLDLIYLHNSSDKKNKANKELKKVIQSVYEYLLNEDYFYAPTRLNSLKKDTEGIAYESENYYPIFRNPHLSRNEQVALKCLRNNTITIREKYLGHLTGVIMVSGKSFVPKTLGGADFDGDLVKIFDNPLVLKAVQRGIQEKEKHLPIININDKENIKTKKNEPKTDSIFKLPTRYKNEIDYRVLYNTFANSIGQISNKAIVDGQRHFASRFDESLSDCAIYTILTGLEIDACKTGLHPYLPPVAYTGFYEETQNNDSDSSEEEKKHSYLLPVSNEKQKKNEDDSNKGSHNLVYELKYKNFIPGEQYTVTLEWKDKKSGEILLSMSESFIPKKMNDTFNLKFEAEHNNYIRLFKDILLPANFKFLESCTNNKPVELHSSYATLIKYGTDKGISIPPEDFSYIDHLIKPLDNLNKGYPTLPSKKSISCTADESITWEYNEKGRKVKINLNNPSSKDYNSLSYLAYLFLYGHMNNTLPGFTDALEKSIKNGTYSSTFPIPDEHKNFLNACIEKYLTFKSLTEKNKKQYYRSIYYILKNQQIKKPDIRYMANELRELLPKDKSVKNHPWETLKKELDTVYNIYVDLHESDWPYLYGEEIEKVFREKLNLGKKKIPDSLLCLLNFRAKGYQLLNLFLFYTMCIIKDEIKEDLKKYPYKHHTDIAFYFADKCKEDFKKQLNADKCKEDQLNDEKLFPYLYTISNDKSSSLYKNYANGKLDIVWLCYSPEQIIENIKIIRSMATLNNQKSIFSTKIMERTTDYVR
ncbi:MAG: hypothetical protein K5659_04180 [Lachnospiraceae bacterium]|nr:hypothetical protein [Lachnospiraceae bacterium]